MIADAHKTARKMVMGNWVDFFAGTQTEWFEEVMVHGMIIGLFSNLVSLCLAIEHPV